MTIKKFTGKTLDEAIKAAKAELGESAIIMSQKNRKPDGVLGILQKSIWEVTAALEDEPDGNVTRLSKPAGFSALPTSTFSVEADEKINLDDLPTPDFTALKPNKPQPVPASFAPKESPKDSRKAEEEAYKSAISEINQILERAEERNKPAYVPPGSNIIKAEKEPKVSDIKDAPKEFTPLSQMKQETKPDNIVPIHKAKASRAESNLPLIRVLYNKLFDNEVEERYINAILDDMGSLLTQANNLDLLLSSIYQKMVLKLGKPALIPENVRGPVVVFFIGPTGVGKTTTIAKIASDFKVFKNKRIAFITADTYRLAATEQLNTYANILDDPITILYNPAEINDAVAKYKDRDLILVDTVGFSHKNVEQREMTKTLLSSLDSKYKSMNYLVLSLTTKYGDLKEIADAYSTFCDYNLIFTKLDETGAFGNILNMKLYTGKSLSYVTNGQIVPDDIEVVDSQKLVKAMLGGA